MGELLGTILNGISFSALLFLLAAGLSLIFGLMNIINLAHGSFYMLGAYVGMSVGRATGSFLVGILAAAGAMAVVGVLMERFCLRYRPNDHLAQVLLTVGFLYIFADIAKMVWGTNPFMMPAPGFLANSVDIMGRPFPLYRLAVILIGVLLGLALWLFQEKTRVGTIVRAGVDDREMVTGFGINIALVSTAIFALGALLAGLGGIIGGPILGAYAGEDAEVLFLALVVVIVGGLGTLRGAMVGSILIGMVDVVAKVLFVELSMFAVFGSMALILLVKPMGILGGVKQ